MKVKPLHSIGIIAIVLALCAGGWLLFQPKKMETVVTYRATTAEQRDAHTSQTTQSSEERQEETLAEKAERTKDRHLELMRALGWKEDEPRMQKLKKVLNSPAYLEYVRKQAEKPGFNAFCGGNSMNRSAFHTPADVSKKSFSANTFQMAGTTPITNRSCASASQKSHWKILLRVQPMCCVGLTRTLQTRSGDTAISMAMKANTNGATLSDRTPPASPPNQHPGMSTRHPVQLNLLAPGKPA